MKANIVLIGGDGIGPEIIAGAKVVLERVALQFDHTFEFSDALLGGIAIDQAGTPLPSETLYRCRRADAVLLGAVGGPKWDDPTAKHRPEQGLLGLRKAMGLYANLRPVRIHQALLASSPLRPERLEGVDLLVVRELTGGIYFGEPRTRTMVDNVDTAADTMVYTAPEVRRVVRLACRLAENRRGKVTSVDKANVLETSRLWRQVADEVAQDFPAVTMEHQLVDSCTMRLIQDAASFDVVVTSNMFGDILTDEAAVLTGSLGVLPSASLGESSQGLYEPIHGSAPDIAGQGRANPLGTILSAAMLLRHSVDLPDEAASVEAAVSQVIAEGQTTRDIGGDLCTMDVAHAVAEAVRS